MAPGRIIEHLEIPVVNGLYFLGNYFLNGVNLLESLVSFAVRSNLISKPLFVSVCYQSTKAGPVNPPDLEQSRQQAPPV